MAEGKDQQESAPKRSTKKAVKADSPIAPAGANQSHAALARKYRPKLFSELIGQDAMVQTLRNAFASGRIAQAYMLTGVRGVGKTTTARLIARALNYVAARRPTARRPSTWLRRASIAAPSSRAGISTWSRWTRPPTPASTTSAT